MGVAMPGVSRSEFLQRVKDATAKSIPPHHEPVEKLNGEVGRAVSADDDIVSIYAERTETAGMNLVRATGTTEARQALAQILKDEGVETLHAWQTPGIEELTSGLDGVSVTWWDAADVDRKDAAYAMKCGLTTVDYAVAETGSLVVKADTTQGRSISMLGESHIAVVRTDQIVPDLHDLYSRLQEDFPDGLPSNVSLITGPSKTADIELQLVIGVHGPGVVHVILIES